MYSDNMENTAAQIEETACRNGALEAECIVRNVHSLCIEVKDGKPEGVKRTEETSVALRVLVDGTKGPGSHAAFWDGTDRSGHRVPSGIYLYRLQAGGMLFTRKMVVLN